MGVKRENFNHKYYIVAREKGRIIARVKWRWKTLNVRKATSIYKSNRTFNPSIKRTALKSKPFDEVTDYSPKITKPRNRPFRYVIEGLLKDNRTIMASSLTKLWGSILEAKLVAEENFFNILSYEVNGVSDEDEGQKLVKTLKSVKRGIQFNR